MRLSKVTPRNHQQTSRQQSGGVDAAAAAAAAAATGPPRLRFAVNQWRPLQCSCQNRDKNINWRESETKAGDERRSGNCAQHVRVSNRNQISPNNLEGNKTNRTSRITISKHGIRFTGETSNHKTCPRERRKSTHLRRRLMSTTERSRRCRQRVEAAQLESRSLKTKKQRLTSIDSAKVFAETSAVRRERISLQ